MLNIYYKINLIAVFFFFFAVVIHTNSNYYDHVCKFDLTWVDIYYQKSTSCPCFYGDIDPSYNVFEKYC